MRSVGTQTFMVPESGSFSPSGEERRGCDMTAMCSSEKPLCSEGTAGHGPRWSADAAFRRVQEDG